MDFDQLVRKYLRGSMSGEELDSLRRLLENVPAYRKELRQILELRSMINDDALRLNPPADLSERTRVLVGTRFAGIEALLHDDAGALVPPKELADSTRDAVARMFAEAQSKKIIPLPIEAAAPTTDPRTRRRAIAIPLRYAFSGLAAAVIATFVAVGPSLRQEIENPSAPLPTTPRQTSATTSPNGGTAVASATTDDRAAGAAEAAPALAGRTIAAPDVASPSTSASASPIDARRTPAATAIAAPTRADVADAASRDGAGAPPLAVASETSPSSPAEESSIAPPRTTTSQPTTETEDVRSTDRSDLRTEPPMLAATSNDALDRSTTIVAASVEPFAFGPEASSNRPRLMAVGVTLGSGSVSEESSPTPLMQNSYYLSFNVSDNDRIGLEMGGSTFMQNRQVAEQQRGPSPFGKGSSSDDSVRTSRPGAAPVTYTIVSQRLAQQITYGGVFYDRRLRIDRSWDVCSRLTFGAADGALVGGLRAYAAYSPSPNVTLTAGVGGSTLFNLTQRSERASLNYGIYYGIETGF